MATWNTSIPDLTNQISADIPDIEENFQELHDVVEAVTTGTLGTTTAANFMLNLRELPGIAVRSKFSWKDGDEIYIDPGAYHHSGTIEQIVYWDSQITFQLQSGGSNSDSHDYGADGWHYVYLDDSAIVTQASNLLDADCFVTYTGANSAPVWTVAKHGWYGDGVGDAKTGDRCIFAVYETGGAIKEFFHEGNMVMYAGAQQPFSVADPTTSFVDLDLSVYMPGFSTVATLTGTHHYIDGAAYSSWRTNGQTDANGHVWGRTDNDSHYDTNTFDVITDSSQVIEHKISANNNHVTIDLDGWKFPIGM